MDLISGPWRARRGDFPWVISGPTGHISSLLWPYLLVKVWCLDWRHRWKWVLWGWSTASGTANWSQSSSAKDGMAKCPPKEGCCEKGPALNGIKTHTHTHVLLWWACHQVGMWSGEVANEIQSLSIIGRLISLQPVPFNRSTPVLHMPFSPFSFLGVTLVYNTQATALMFPSLCFAFANTLIAKSSCD